MITGKTKSGFEFQVDENALDNMELVDAIADIGDDPDPVEVSHVIKLLFSKEEKRRLYDHVRDKSTNRVPLKKLGDEIADIFESLGEGNEEVKN